MKIVIDIPEERYEFIKGLDNTCYDIHAAIAQGIPYEEKPICKWELVADDKVNLEFIYRCSECGREVSIYNTSRLTEIYPFCHCGADMRKGDAE